MQYIDEKFKDMKPEDTVRRIQDILRGIGIEVEEDWNDSGVESCYSLTVSARGGVPSANGKGVTKEFARASAYGEFIERLQGGLFMYKFQSVGRDPDMNLQNSAPDAKYMTVEELEENGEWMDKVIMACKNPRVTRKSIAKLCRIYACADDGRILTLPFYSLFEKKHVYLPIAFVDQIYATNGCCAGNTREEAWVHALSEMMERHATLAMLTGGQAAAKFPDEVIGSYPVVSQIIRDIRSSGKFDIDIFDYSIGNGFPVVSTRIINKTNHSYRVNVAADPVFEIALQRTLTELMQGKNIKNFTSRHAGKIVNDSAQLAAISNVINQLETGSGVYSADFFANEIVCKKEATVFEERRDKNNRELLDYMLNLYRELDRPVYVRNFSYLGFPCYRFVVPGFSEAYIARLSESFPEYALADEACKTMKMPKIASENDLNWLLGYMKLISGIFGRYHFFGRIAGVPLSGSANIKLACMTRAYAAYRVGQYDNAIKFMEPWLKSDATDEEKAYFACVERYIELKKMGVEAEKIQLILGKFFEAQYVNKLYDVLNQGKTPYDEYLLQCDRENCDRCQYKTVCCYDGIRKMYAKVGAVYQTFVNGQAVTEFE